MKKSTKKTLVIATAAVLLAATVATTLLVMLPGSGKQEKPDKGYGELYTRQLLESGTIKDVVDDCYFTDELVKSDENYVTVPVEKFRFSDEIGLSSGYTNIRYDAEHEDKITELQHMFVTYVEDGQDSKTVFSEQVAQVNTNLAQLLGFSAQKLTALPLEGEFDPSLELSEEEMLAGAMEGKYALYCMYENDDGIKYEANVVFANNTIYTTVWNYLCAHD